MTSPINPIFEDIRLTVQRAADGRFWFVAQTVCQALELADEQAALLLHCRPEGILFGNEETPQAMIDLENLLRLSLSRGLSLRRHPNRLRRRWRLSLSRRHHRRSRRRTGWCPLRS
jgi:prophage antirepressor-like protein